MKIVFFVFIAALLTVVSWRVDHLAFHDLYTSPLIYGKDCGFEMPPGYSLYWSEKYKAYAIKCPSRYSDGRVEYLYNNSKYGIAPYLPSITVPSLFNDTCAAKAFLKSYLEDQQPKFK